MDSQKVSASVNSRQAYRLSYTCMEECTLKGGHGVCRLCVMNRNVSSIAVPDAEKRRKKSKDWRRKCSVKEFTKLGAGNLLLEKAVTAENSQSLGENLGTAYACLAKVCEILDTDFGAEG